MNSYETIVKDITTFVSQNRFDESIKIFINLYISNNWNNIPVEYKFHLYSQIIISYYYIDKRLYNYFCEIFYLFIQDNIYFVMENNLITQNIKNNFIFTDKKYHFDIKITKETLSTTLSTLYQKHKITDYKNTDYKNTDYKNTDCKITDYKNILSLSIDIDYFQDMEILNTFIDYHILPLNIRLNTLTFSSKLSTEETISQLKQFSLFLSKCKLLNYSVNIHNNYINLDLKNN